MLAPLFSYFRSHPDVESQAKFEPLTEYYKIPLTNSGSASFRVL